MLKVMDNVEFEQIMFKEVLLFVFIFNCNKYNYRNVLMA